MLAGLCWRLSLAQQLGWYRGCRRSRAELLLHRENAKRDFSPQEPVAYPVRTTRYTCNTSGKWVNLLLSPVVRRIVRCISQMQCAATSAQNEEQAMSLSMLLDKPQPPVLAPGAFTWPPAAATSWAHHCNQSFSSRQRQRLAYSCLIYTFL